ncbi:MAG: hypothetical protein QXQ18_01260 [Candidatus Aenigmatarchaeota archaeon]
MKEEDWKNCLHPEDKELLLQIIERAKKHHCAYEKAEDVKVAQLWTALLEMQKEINEMKATQAKVIAPFKSIVEIGEAAKKREIERLVTEIIKPTDEESQEATRKLVESLMKF